MSRLAMRVERMPGPDAARFIQDELLLDGAPAFNLAGFATTYMDSSVDDRTLKNLVCCQFIRGALRWYSTAKV